MLHGPESGMPNETKSLQFKSPIDGYLCFLLVARQAGAPIQVSDAIDAKGTLQASVVELDYSLEQQLRDLWAELWPRNRTANAVWSAAVGAPSDLRRRMMYEDPDYESEDSEIYDRSRKVDRDTLARCFVSGYERIQELGLEPNYLKDDPDIGTDYSKLRSEGVQPLDGELATIMIHQAVRENGVEIPLPIGN